MAQACQVVRWAPLSLRGTLASERHHQKVVQRHPQRRERAGKETLGAPTKGCTGARSPTKDCNRELKCFFCAFTRIVSVQVCRCMHTYLLVYLPTCMSVRLSAPSDKKGPGAAPGPAPLRPSPVPSFRKGDPLGGCSRQVGLAAPWLARDQRQRVQATCSKIITTYRHDVMCVCNVHSKVTAV